MKILLSYRLNFGLVFLTFQALEISFVTPLFGLHYKCNETD